MINVVYCLTSTGDDIYESMTRVSLATLRLTNPSAHVMIACDKNTYSDLESLRSRLLCEADLVQSFYAPLGTSSFRNRFIKTQLGRLVEGPFLFLDSDTIIRRSLAAFEEINVDVAAAPNKSMETLESQVDSTDMLVDIFGSPVHNPYVNAGVVFFGGTPASASLSDAWHQIWLTNYRNTGLHNDQSSFNCSLNNVSNLTFASLDHGYNFQYYYKRSSEGGEAGDARIWHAYSSLKSHPADRFAYVCKKVQAAKPASLPDDLIRMLVHSSCPFFGAKSARYWKLQLFHALLSLKRYAAIMSRPPSSWRSFAFSRSGRTMN